MYCVGVINDADPNETLADFASGCVASLKLVDGSLFSGALPGIFLSFHQSQGAPFRSWQGVLVVVVSISRESCADCIPLQAPRPRTHASCLRTHSSVFASALTCEAAVGGSPYQSRCSAEETRGTGSRWRESEGLRSALVCLSSRIPSTFIPQC